MKTRYLIVIGTFILSIFGSLVWSVFHFNQKVTTAENESRVLRSDNALQEQVIATQVLNINRFNQTAQTTARANAIVVGSSEKTVIEYREIFRREKTCDLPVPAATAGGLLEYTDRLRTSAMYADPDEPDAADDRAVATSSMTYCQAVLWIESLLAVLRKVTTTSLGFVRLSNSANP